MEDNADETSPHGYNGHGFYAFEHRFLQREGEDRLAGSNKTQYGSAYWKIDKYPDESPTFKPTAPKLLELAKSS